jgi:hypothetical protein
MKIGKKINKLLAASVLFIMLFTAFVGATSSIETATEETFVKNNSPETLDGYTHTVMVEACTASWCPPCATAAAVMHDVFYSGDYDFYYVALVSDKNTYASGRCSELGASSIPDYVFDGGYTRKVGSCSASVYISKLDSCGARVVSDIDLDLEITWNGDASIDVNLDITNNEASTYNGHVHVYVTEIVSRWNTYNGQPYHFAMVGNYAFNENVDITAGDTSQHSTTWDGSQYGVGDLTEDNVMVIATIFDRNNNNYVDETAAESFVELWPDDLELEITGGVGTISATLKNNGTSAESDINWNIQVEGGILGRIDVYTEGIVESLLAGEETVLQTDESIFGLGRITVSVNVNVGTKTKQGFVIGPFILL